MISGLYCIADENQSLDLSVLEQAELFLQGGATLIQLRQKHASPSHALNNALALAKLKQKRNFCFIVNDDPELAREVGADGVHLGQGDGSVTRAREILGKDKIIGLSTHDLAQVVHAQKEDVNYLGFGAVFPTQSKPKGHPTPGIALLREAVQMSSKPLVAIGGITLKNLPLVVETRVAAVAVISDLIRAHSIPERVRDYILFLCGKNKEAL